MMMMPFQALFPDEDFLAYLEIVPNASEPSAPPSAYDIMDFYCPDSRCDCCKVSLKIIDDEINAVATISYGWKPMAYYVKRGLDQSTARRLTQGFLDPLEEQSPQASFLLEAFQKTFLKEDSFLTKMRERYEVFKEEIDVYHEEMSQFYDTLKLIKDTIDRASPPYSKPSKIKDFAAYKRRKS